MSVEVARGRDSAVVIMMMMMMRAVIRAVVAAGSLDFFFAPRARVLMSTPNTCALEKRKHLLCAICVSCERDAVILSEEIPRMKVSIKFRSSRLFLSAVEFENNFSFCKKKKSNEQVQKMIIFKVRAKQVKGVRNYSVSAIAS